MINKRNRWALISMSILFILGCGNPGGHTEKTKLSPLEENLPEYVANPGMENPAIYLRIIGIEQNDSSYVCSMKALNDTDTIGLQLEVSKGIQPGLNPDGSANMERGFSEGTMRFRSTGQISDNFFHALGDLYQIPTETGMRKEEIAPLVFSSNTEEVSFGNNKTYRFKLFFTNELGEEAEVFVVIDLYKRLFEFRSKDVTYFARVIDAFHEPKG